MTQPFHKKQCQICKKDRPIVSFARRGGPYAEWCEVCFDEAGPTKPCHGCHEPIPRGRERFCSPLCQIRSHCSGTDNPDGCWVWNGAKRENGYGVVRVRLPQGNGLRTAARAAYAAAFGEVPETYSVLNTCGTKNCCNPKHLSLGVQERELTDESPLVVL